MTRGTNNNKYMYDVTFTLSYLLKLRFNPLSAIVGYIRHDADIIVRNRVTKLEFTHAKKGLFRKGLGT